MNVPDAPPNKRNDDGWRRVRGQTRFAADVTSAGALHAAFALASEPHARLRSIDTSGAEALPGVAAILTGADIGEHRFGRSLRDHPILAVDRVLFAGQRVAAIAACDPETAQRAVELLDIQYEPLEKILDPRTAMDDGRIELHPDYARYVGARPERRTNVQGTDAEAEGDFSGAWPDCTEHYEHRFSWGRSHAAPLEPHACMVIAADDAVHVYSAHKVPFKLRDDLAQLSGRRPEDIIVHPTPIGGDFGSKGSPYLEGACYFLSLATGRPVRAVMSYFELLTTTSARHPGEMTLRSGLREGRFHAHAAQTFLDGGAFAAHKPRATHVLPVLGLPLAPYAVPHRLERVTGVYTNTLPGGQVRAPGEFQATFAGESHVDMIARARGEDPLLFRERTLEDAQARRVLAELGAVMTGWRERPSASMDVDRTSRGVGLSLFHRSAGRGRTMATCRASSDGVEVKVAVADQGGGSSIAFERLCADALSIPVGSVRIRPVGTDAGLVDAGTGSSRVTTVAGRAVADAAAALLQEIGEPPPEGGDPYWISARLASLGVHEATGAADHTVRRGETPAAHGGVVLELCVDVDTGVIHLHRAALVVEAGPVLNPVGHRGQLEGGFVFGLSQTLYEDLSIVGGRIATASLGDYKLASAADVPPLEIRLLEPELAVGQQPIDAVRAVGELGNLGVAPAIANAIHDAVGVRLCSLPISAEDVWRELRSREEG